MKKGDSSEGKIMNDNWSDNNDDFHIDSCLLDFGSNCIALVAKSHVQCQNSGG